jgi:glutaredoxin|tara:strand:+ start:1035 stop:1292 length:258 start_codon:yes stop_codon:yes gene_type:complete
MITVYTKTVCGYCGVAKRWLKNNGFTFEEVNIEHDPEARNLLVQNGFRSVPQIFYNKKLLVEGGADGLKKETKETLQEKIDACSK